MTNKETISNIDKLHYRRIVEIIANPKDEFSSVEIKLQAITTCLRHHTDDILELIKDGVDDTPPLSFKVVGCVAHGDDAGEYPLYCNNCHHAPTGSDQCQAYRMKELMTTFTE